ncbi:hypothetical protein V6582_03650 [Agrobacterium vitis]|nr:hypothetical protein [Agrobacterium vitis]
MRRLAERLGTGRRAACRLMQRLKSVEICQRMAAVVQCSRCYQSARQLRLAFSILAFDAKRGRRQANQRRAGRQI